MRHLSDSLGEFYHQVKKNISLTFNNISNIYLQVNADFSLCSYLCNIALCGTERQTSHVDKVASVKACTPVNMVIITVASHPCAK